jgi:hypothetical protein
MNAPEWTLVTGASSGIGWELARCFAADGSNLVLVARSEDKLRQLAGELKERHGVETVVIVQDLAEVDAAQCVFEELQRQQLHVDVLVNNAGFGMHGCFAEQSLERQLEMVCVNVLALVHLTGLLLPGMLERKRGGVLNVASTAAFQPGPGMAVYFATKAFVYSFSEALVEETAGSGVRVTCLAPGPVDTGFAATADIESTPLFKLGTFSAEKVARSGHRAFRRGRSLKVPGLKNNLGRFSAAFSPRFLTRKIAGWLVKK